MITLVRWYLMKAKEIKLKLAFYSLLEQGIEELANNKDEIKKEFIHELAVIIHNMPVKKGIICNYGYCNKKYE